MEVKGEGDVNEEKGYGNGFWKKGRVLGKGSGKGGREGLHGGGGSPRKYLIYDSA